jgi:hypothetical protein
MIQERFRGDIHYVWCSELCDSKSAGVYSSAALIPPSSNPADIYRELQRDVKGKDKHSAKISEQKMSLLKLAVDWENAKEISSDERDEIIYLTEHASFDEWRPLLYVIPSEPVKSRLKLVPPAKRAGFGVEYIIEDLKRFEFDTVEL